VKAALDGLLIAAVAVESCETGGCCGTLFGWTAGCFDKAASDGPFVTVAVVEVFLCNWDDKGTPTTVTFVETGTIGVISSSCDGLTFFTGWGVMRGFEALTDEADALSLFNVLMF
jgi:hypothetical protein